MTETDVCVINVFSEKQNYKMYTVLLKIAILASCYKSVVGQSDCLTPNSVDGTCIPLNQCYLLLKVVKNVNITQQDLEFLKKSQCGFDGTDPKVCCPKYCITPASDKGTCVSIQSCPTLNKLLQLPLSKEHIKYVQGSRCPGSQEDTVCCPPDKPTAAARICAATVSAFLSDPKTECCGMESALGRTNEGTAKTSIYQYPWMVALEYYYEGFTKILATGSLISALYVLTVAQAVTGIATRRNGKPVSVRLGEYNTANSFAPDCVLTKDNITECTDGMIRIDVKRIIPHPDYKADWVETNIHDIALIRLNQKAPFSDFIRPICLPSVDLTVTPPAGVTLFVAGWGSPNANERFSRVKLQVDLPLVARDRCQTLYTEAQINAVLTKGHLCAGGVVGKSSCSGDAGAPLMYQRGNTFEAVGLTSFGARPCGRAIPGVYTNVYEYIPWIRRSINIDLTIIASDD